MIYRVNPSTKIFLQQDKVNTKKITLVCNRETEIDILETPDEFYISVFVKENRVNPVRHHKSVPR